LLVPYILAAVRMCDSGFASAEDIDNGIVLGSARPMRPLGLADLVGLDAVKAIAEARHEGFSTTPAAPSPNWARTTTPPWSVPSSITELITAAAASDASTDSS
jgi:3-hydroxybutyryl-CoA dehydrogenase